MELLLVELNEEQIEALKCIDEDLNKAIDIVLSDIKYGRYKNLDYLDPIEFFLKRYGSKEYISFKLKDLFVEYKEACREASKAYIGRNKFYLKLETELEYFLTVKRNSNENHFVYRNKGDTV